MDEVVGSYAICSVYHHHAANFIPQENMKLPTLMFYQIGPKNKIWNINYNLFMTIDVKMDLLQQSHPAIH